MVIRIGAGEVGPSISNLVKDTRSMLEPETASRLKASQECFGKVHVDDLTLYQ